MDEGKTFDAALALEVPFSGPSTLQHVPSFPLSNFPHISFSWQDFWFYTMKVIEHVANPAEFCKSLSALTVPNGATLLSTINRSMRAYASAIVAAEYILRWVIASVSHLIYLLLTPFFWLCVVGFISDKCIINLLQLPKGTHQWSSFLTPEELTMILQRASIDVSHFPSHSVVLMSIRLKQCKRGIVHLFISIELLPIYTVVEMINRKLWIAGERDGWICVQPDNRKMVIVRRY